MSSNPVPERPTPYFELDSEQRLAVVDPIENARSVVKTGCAVDPTPAPTTGFPVPIDTAVNVELESFEPLVGSNFHVRDLQGNTIDDFVSPGDGRETYSGDYVIETNSNQIKIYLRTLGGEFAIAVAGPGEARFEAPSPIPARIGTRSSHTHPARAIETTGEPADLMEVFSLLGSSVKTWSPERAYPTLRGHPPLIEPTDAPDRSDAPSPPDTGIQVTVPAEYEWVYPAAPLAYWFGATVAAGEPTLILDGDEYPLGAAAGYGGATEQQAFERHVTDILQGTFKIEAAARRWYEWTTDVETQLERADISVDLEAVYNLPIAERTRRYLQIDTSFAVLNEQVTAPTWPGTAYIEPVEAQVELLPYLLRDLAVIRISSSERISHADDPAEAVNGVTGGSAGIIPDSGFTRGGGTPSVRTVIGRGTEAVDSLNQTDTSLVIVPEANSADRLWAGEGVAVNAINVSTDSYQHRLDEQAAENNDATRVDVVVNDPEMVEEGGVTEHYGLREMLSFRINIHEPQSTNELGAIFERDTDFVHYIGHIDADGFRCADGHLDAAELDHVGTSAFILNACQSYEQGRRLVENGAVAGIVTVNDVLSPLATEIGQTAAQLLNQGYGIGITTRLIREYKAAGHHYIAVGDPLMTLVQYVCGTPEVWHLSAGDNSEFKMYFEAFPSVVYGVGAVIALYKDRQEFLIPGQSKVHELDGDDLQTQLEAENSICIIDGEMYWPHELTVDEVRTLLETE